MSLRLRARRQKGGDQYTCCPLNYMSLVNSFITFAGVFVGFVK